MNTFKIIVVLIICLASSVAWAGEKAAHQAKAELFFKTVMEGQVDRAYDKLLEGSPIKQKTQAVTLLKKQTSVALAIYGKLLGFEFIKQENYGNSIVRLVYILKCEQVPLTWEFYFYKPKTNWILVNIKFNDQYDLLADK